MLKKCWSSGEYPFRSSHDHKFRSLLHVHLERKETCECEIVDVPGIVKAGRSLLSLTLVMIGNHQFLVIYFSPACWETFTPSDHSSCCSWFRTEVRYRRAGEMDPGTSTVSFPDHPTSSLKLRRWWWGRVEGGVRGWGVRGGRQYVHTQQIISVVLGDCMFAVGTLQNTVCNNILLFPVSSSSSDRLFHTLTLCGKRQKFVGWLASYCCTYCRTASWFEHMIFLHTLNFTML